VSGCNFNPIILIPKHPAIQNNYSTVDSMPLILFTPDMQSVLENCSRDTCWKIVSLCNTQCKTLSVFLYVRHTATRSLCWCSVLWCPMVLSDSHVQPGWLLGSDMKEWLNSIWKTTKGKHKTLLNSFPDWKNKLLSQQPLHILCAWPHLRQMNSKMK